jgi:hypothetical protein
VLGEKDSVKAWQSLVRNEMVGELRLCQKYYEDWGRHGVVDMNGTYELTSLEDRQNLVVATSSCLELSLLALHMVLV